MWWSSTAMSTTPTAIHTMVNRASLLRRSLWLSLVQGVREPAAGEARGAAGVPAAASPQDGAGEHVGDVLEDALVVLHREDPLEVPRIVAGRVLLAGEGLDQAAVALDVHVPVARQGADDGRQVRPEAGVRAQQGQ